MSQDALEGKDCGAAPLERDRPGKDWLLLLPRV